MKIESILAPERTHCGLTASSKKRAIEEAAIQIAKVMDNLTSDDIYERLINREKLGTTGIGHGIAIPHCRVEGCTNIVGGLFTLTTPVDFGAFDDEPVNVLCVLLVPAEEVDDHLKALSMLAQRFESESYRTSLKNARDDKDLYERAIAEVPIGSS